MPTDAASAGDNLGALLFENALPDAIRRVDAALARGDDPELRLLRGQLAYMTGDFDDARSHLEAAVRTFEHADLPQRAALAASWVGRTYFDGIGNRVAGRAWLTRASRMIEGLPPSVEQGWVALGLVGCSVGDVAELEANANLALGLARRFGDTSLEAKALADGGLALVSLGRVPEGMEWLDAAMALMSGSPDLPSQAQVACCLFTACQRAGDLRRAAGWLEVLEQLGLLSRDRVMTFGHCHAVYGSLLCEVGRWDDAETTLMSALDVGRGGHYFIELQTRAALGDLRVRQGRLDDAERLLLGLDDRLEALGPLARLHLARGEYDLAAAVARRGLRMLGMHGSRCVPFLSIVVEAELGRGDEPGAARAAAEMSEAAEASHLPSLTAQAAFAGARVAAAGGDRETALAQLDEALAMLGSEELPLLRASIHFGLARLQAVLDRAAATSEARAALALHARLDVPVPHEAAALLADLGLATTPGHAAVASAPAALWQEGQFWMVRQGSTAGRLRDSKGLRYLADLIARPGSERHVLDLVDLVEGVPAQGGFDRRDLGDAGGLLDAAAKAAYRRRIEALREELDDAEAAGGEARATTILAEIDTLVTELARSMGLGGRDRRASSAAEKARVNVTRAIRSAIAKVGEVVPELGRHLDRHVHTGFFCSYDPPAGSGISWSRSGEPGQQGVGAMAWPKQNRLPGS